MFKFFDFPTLAQVDQETPSQFFEPLDGKKLAYRHYKAKSSNAILMIHGAGQSNGYLHSFALSLSQSQVGHIYTLDLYGHGYSEGSRGDVDSMDQLEVHVNEFAEFIKKSHQTIILGGHSAGGSLAIRVLNRSQKGGYKACLLIAPFLGADSKTSRKNIEGSIWLDQKKFSELIPKALQGHQASGQEHVLYFDYSEETRLEQNPKSYSIHTMLAYFLYSDAEFTQMRAPSLTICGDS